MDVSSHHAAHNDERASDDEALGETTGGSKETPTPDPTSSNGQHPSDDAAGDEGIDEPAADE
jgi:hypothetical protein